MFGGLGFTEILVILVVALIFLGPKRLPDAARQLGRGIAEFRRASNDLRSSLNLDVSDPEPFPPRREPAPKRPAAEAPEATTPMGEPASSAAPAPEPQTAESTSSAQGSKPSAVSSE